ncbi:MAG: hypothetical protein HFJ89_03065 [Oscillospiraceae bacterium]|jgi:hypothetical protein|nr:hypothetical protein [Oscillospiraceae bacterium]
MNEKKQIFSGSFDDMLAAFLATYALASFSYEKYMPESFMRIFSFAVLTLFAAAWLWFSFRSGLRNGKKFPLFAILFWILPHIIIYLADNGPEFMRMSIAMYILSEFMNFFTAVPAEVFGNVLGITAPAATAVILLFSGSAYMSGYLVYTRRLEKGNYTYIK